MLSVLSAGLPDEDGTGDVTWGTPTLQSAPGNLTITVSSPTAVSDDHPIVLVTFQALAVGTATITPTAGSVVSAVPGQAVAVTETGASATIDAALAPPATSQLSLAPPASPSDLARTATASSPVGSQITVPVYADVTSGEVNEVSATVDYPAGLLQYDSAQVNTAAWGTTIQNTGGAGVVQIATSSTSPQPAGSFLVATITFTALAPGAATVTFDASSSEVADANNAQDGGVSLNALDGTAGATYTITSS
jgi:hypothetical protein